ncbi:MAG: response regulator [Anaerolineae bacterium]
MIRILVIDPDKQMADSVTRALEAEKMAASVVWNREDALHQLLSDPPHAVVLAVDPSGNWGEELCREVCERTFAPLLAVGKREQDAAVERALAAGADAHILQPFTSGVFTAQLWALLRRVGLIRPAYPA